MSRPTRTPRRRWPLLLITLLLLAAGAVLLAWGALSALNTVPVSLTIDGERIFSGLDPAALPPAHKLLLAALLAFALLATLIVVPVALLLTLLGVLVAALAIVGLPLLAVFALLALLLSPLLLAGWLLWKLVVG
jgi:hypothetical protein